MSPDLPPAGNGDATLRWGPLDPVEIGVGCALGCETELEVGPVSIPFGLRPDRGARSRMDDTELDVVTQGLQLDGTAPGLAAHFEPLPRLGLDTAFVGDGHLGRALDRGPTLPDLAARASWDFGDFELGGSVWAGVGGDDAVSGDASWFAGWWTVGVEVLREHIGNVQEEFDKDLSVKEVVGEGVALRVDRDLGTWWQLGSSAETRMFVKNKGFAAPPWARAVADLRFDPSGPVRWTVLELAVTRSLREGPGTEIDDVRLSTQVDLARRRSRDP